MRKPALYVVERKEVFILSTLFVFVAIFAFILGTKYGRRMEQARIVQLEENLEEKKVLSTPKALSSLKKEKKSMETPALLEAEKEKKGMETPALLEGEKEAFSALQAVREERSRNLKEEKKPMDMSKEEEKKEEAPKGMPKLKALSEELKLVELSVEKKKLEETKHEKLLEKQTVEGVENPPFFYTIQAASFPTHKDASDYIRTLKLRGLKPYILDSFPLDKGSRWYRVGIGKFSTYAAAEAKAKEYVKEKSIQTYFIRKENLEK